MYRTLVPMLLLASLSSVACSTEAYVDDDVFDPHASLTSVVQFDSVVDAFDPFDLRLVAVDPIVFPADELCLLDVFDELHRRGLGTTSLV